MSLMKDNVILSKSFEFAISAVRICMAVRRRHSEYDMTKQLSRSATSIGANATEADAAYSRKEFEFKMQIAYKEARESHYWIKVMKKVEYLNYQEAQDLLAKCEELVMILNRILISSKQARR